MKNAKYEARRQSAIRWLASGNACKGIPLVDGVYVPHSYEVKDVGISFWDDFGFRLNRQWINVTWLHPRMALLDLVDDIAFAETDKVATYYISNFRDEFTPNYTKIGRSRKKAKTSTWNPGEVNSEYFATQRRIRHDILTGTAYAGVSVPSNKLTIEQMSYGKFVEVRTPAELLSEADVISFAHKLKAHLKGEINILGDKDATYSIADYQRDMTAVGLEIK